MKEVATMAEKEITIHTDEHGNEVTVQGNEIVKITNPRGKEYVAKNLGTRADAELVKAVEDFRWANQMTVSEVVLAALKEYIAHG